MRFMIMHANDGMDEAIELSRRYAKILGGTLEIDVRLVEQEETV
jgi:hypothetical protein